MANRTLDLIGYGEANDLDAWLRRHAILMLAAGAAAATLRTGSWIAVAGTVSFGLLWLRHGIPGLANRITAARLVAVLLAAAALGHQPQGWLFALLVANVIADVVDGHIARRRHEATPFGAVFDRETDAVFVLVAYVYFVVGGLDAWFAALGLLPYVYRLATHWRPHAVPPDHKERAAQWLAGINFILLLAAFMQPSHARELLLASAIVVLVSFSMSFGILFRHARLLRQ